MPSFTYARTTQFAECDPAGVVHFSNVSRYVEEAEHAFYASRGYPVEMADPDGLRWPRAEFRASYTRPIPPYLKLQVVLDPQHVGRSSISWKWSLRVPEIPEVLSEGEMKVVCCVKQGKGFKAFPIPDDLRKQLTDASGGSG